MLNEAARSGSSSVFTFPNTMATCFSEVASNTGAKPLHGPHQGAQKSTRTMSLAFTTCSKLSLVNAIVAMRGSPEFVESRDYNRGVYVPNEVPSENPQSSASIRVHRRCYRNPSAELHARPSYRARPRTKRASARPG